MSRRPVVAAFTALSLSISTVFLGAGIAVAAPPPDGPTAADPSAISGPLGAKVTDDRCAW